MSDGNLDFIEQLGMGEPTTEENTESLETKEVNQDSPEEDFVQEPTEQTVDKEETQEDTEPNELAELKKQMDIMQKRIDDKDNYIQELREQSKKKEAESSEEDGVEEDSEDEFWEDPVGKYKELQQQMKIQQLQIQETIYANTVDDYWKTVNQDALKEAVATDTEFAQKFNSSKEPYKTAYEYLTAKKTAKVKSEESLREQIRKELLAEMGKDKPKKETVPSTTNLGGKSGDSPKGETEDGFMAVFGRN
jgi:hypothetical protein